MREGKRFGPGKAGTPGGEAATVVGTFEKSRFFGFVRADGPQRDIYIAKKHWKTAKNGDKVLVRLLKGGSKDRRPEGEITEVIGRAGDRRAEVTAIVRALGIPGRFPVEVRREAERIPETVGKKEAGRRKDYRGLLTVTIDGEDARDLDDAVTLSREEDGYLLGVHIADVSHYVREGSLLDREARRRGTSVYLADRVIPMLPRALSNGICSLNAGEDRLALSCLMHIDRRGNVTEHRIEESVIRVDRRMSYTGVQAILAGKSHPEGDREEIRALCRLMEETAAVLKEKRRRRGAIEFDFPESKILLDASGRPVDVRPYERNTATDIIEDFMLLANETVAEDCFWQELPFLYRVHEEPDAERIRQLDHFIRTFGYYLKRGRDVFHPKEIQKLLFSLEGEPEEALISRLALRSMKRAGYATLNIGHFGLSTQYYTHFTSPIRRYPDLQIHRIIKENLHGRLTAKRIAHYEEILPDVARESSALSWRAQDAEREVEKYEKTEYMRDRIGERFFGVISGVQAWGFYVELPNTVEGLVPVASLDDDFYILEEENYRLVGREHGRVFTPGQRVEVVPTSVDRLRRRIDFHLVSRERRCDRNERSDRLREGDGEWEE